MLAEELSLSHCFYSYCCLVAVTFERRFSASKRLEECSAKSERTFVMYLKKLCSKHLGNLLRSSLKVSTGLEHK